jgi:integrase
MEGSSMMNYDGLDIRKIKTLRSDEKMQMVVSVNNSMHGRIIVSRFGDVVWDFYPYIPQENLKASNKVINWGVTLPDGLTLTSPAHSILLESTKDFIWSLFSDPVEGRKRSSMATLIMKFELMQPLLRWMVAQGLNRFQRLDGRTLDYIPIARMSNFGDKNVSEMTLHYRLHILEYLYLQRNKLNDALINHPWPNETAQALSGKKRTSTFRKPTTEVIPDNIANDLARVSIDYIKNRYPTLRDAVRCVNEAVETKKSFQRQAQTNARTRTAKDLGFSGMHELKKQIFHFRTACYIVIDLFSGIRDSEMMSLEKQCISRTLSSDRSTEIIWMHGIIYKTGKRPKKWIVPEIVVLAVEVLSEMTEHLRSKLLAERTSLKLLQANCDQVEKRKKLAKRFHTVDNQSNKLFLSVATKFSNEISVLSGHKLNLDLKSFCSDHGISTVEGPYPLHSHQFRRTYARFMARAELGDLLMLRDHFGHASLDMTTYYTEGATDDFDIDTELLEMVSEEKKVRQKEIIRGYLTSDAPLANGAHWLKEWRSAVRTAKNKEQLISEYSETLTLNGTGHSWCVGNSKGMGCGGLCVFEAQLCVDCHYGIIGPEHRPIWSGIRDQQKEVLALNDIGPGGRARTVYILEYAEKVLDRLNGVIKDE